MVIEKLGLPQRCPRRKSCNYHRRGAWNWERTRTGTAWLGAVVIIAEIADTGAEVEVQIRAEGGQAYFIQTDVSAETSMQNLADRCFAEFGKVDILVNNAIITYFGGIIQLPLTPGIRRTR